MSLVVTYGTPVGVINAKTDFGAKGDNSTDDTTAIAAAIAAAAGSSNGGRVYIPPGVYITSPIALPPGVVLEGANGQAYYNATTTIPNSNNQSRLKLKAASSGALISPDDTGANKATACKILNLALDCNGITQPAVNLPDQVGSISRFWTLEGVYAFNAGGASGNTLYIGNQNTAITLRDCIVFGGTSGSPGGWNGIGWYGSDGRADNCYIGYMANVGLNILGGASDETLAWRGGGIFTSGGANVAIGGGGAVFEGASIDHGRQHGVYVNNGPVVFTSCTFHGNSSTGSGSYSDIHVAGSSIDVTVLGCRTPDGGTTPKNFINVVGSSVNLRQYGNMNSGGVAYTAGFVNFSPSASLSDSIISDLGVGESLASPIGPGTLPTGAIVETVPRKVLNSATVGGSSGNFRGILVHLEAGTVVTSLTWQAGTTALSAGTHQWFAITDTTGLVLAVTADDTSTAWSANTVKTLALTAPYTIPASGGYYLGHCVVATTIPTHFGIAPTLPTLTPYVTAIATGQTTPPVVGSTLTLASAGSVDYGYAS